MVFFDFGINTIEQVVDELSQAEKYIRIAVFQLHNQRIFDVLQKKLAEGLNIEIFTLPYDSINQDVQERVKSQFIKLRTAGAVLYFCRWNIGTPERTTTADGRWYSYHGKFIITDKSAIILTANFIDQDELDAILIFKDDEQKILEFNNKFDELLDLFINDDLEGERNIRYKIKNSTYNDPDSLFQLPKVIHSDIHKDYWITDYPNALCPSEIDLSDKLYLCPFDSRGRNLVLKIINQAEKYIYLSTESLTDPDIVDDIILRKFEGLDVNIITGATSMDFSDRLNKQFVTMLSSGIQIRSPMQKLHAKLLITDKCVAVSSINFNKINLGISTSSHLWRENTETINICFLQDTILEAKEKFEHLFDNSVKIETILVGSLEKDAKKIFLKYFGLRSEKGAKELFAKFMMQDEINSSKSIFRLGKITKSILRYSNRKIVTKNDFFMALILHSLSESKLKYTHLEMYLSRLCIMYDLPQLLTDLQSYGLIEMEDDFYKLRVLSLF